MERTFAIIKPDAVKKRVAGQILARIEAAGFTIRGMRMIHMSKAEAEGFYYVHKARPFFGGLTDFMSSGPCVVMCLEAEGAIKKWRDLMGATDPAKAEPGTCARTSAPRSTTTPRTDRTLPKPRPSSWATSSGAWSCKCRIKADRWIRKMALEHGMIEPFEDRQVRQGVVSYGVSSYGYDCRVGNEFKVFTNVYNTVVDPKNFDPQSFVDIKADVCIVPPNSFALASTVEYFRIPRDVLTVCLGKSTYARCGIIVNVTPFEPEWEGHVTIEISNTTPLPAKIYANEGIAQVLFFQSDEQCEISYKDKKGKYQAQRGVTLPKI